MTTYRLRSAQTGEGMQNKANVGDCGFLIEDCGLTGEAVCAKQSQSRQLAGSTGGETQDTASLQGRNALRRHYERDVSGETKPIRPSPKRRAQPALQEGHAKQSQCDETQARRNRRRDKELWRESTSHATAKTKPTCRTGTDANSFAVEKVCTAHPANGAGRAKQSQTWVE